MILTPFLTFLIFCHYFFFFDLDFEPFLPLSPPFLVLRATVFRNTVALIPMRSKHIAAARHVAEVAGVGGNEVEHNGDLALCSKLSYVSAFSASWR
jgi:hypothetical protein